MNDVVIIPFGSTGTRYSVKISGRACGFLVKSGDLWIFDYKPDNSITKAPSPELAVARKMARLHMSQLPERSGTNKIGPGGLHNGGYDSMEIWEVVGVDKNAKISFNDGRTVNGVRWYLVGDAPADPNRYMGKVVKDQFVSNERLAALNVAPKPGETIVLYFNRYGDIAKVEIAA